MNSTSAVTASRPQPVYIDVSAEVSYWEDANVNGVNDDDGDLIPGRSGDRWCAVIRLDDGAVMDWPAGTTADICYKICDQGEYWLLDAERRRIAKWGGDYVPDDTLCGGKGYGDYIELVVGADGRVEGWRQPEIEWADSEDDQACWFGLPPEPLSAADQELIARARGIVAAGATKGPRITRADIEAAIASEVYIHPHNAALDALRFQFLTDDHSDPEVRGKLQTLFERMSVMSTASVRAEVDELMAIPGESTEPLKLLTFCVLVLKNGFTVTGESACAVPENFNAAIGARIARENAIAKIWPLLGFNLKQRLHELAQRQVLFEADALADLNGEPRSAKVQA